MEDQEFEVEFTATVRAKITVYAENEDDAKFEVEIGRDPKEVLEEASEWEADIDVSSVKLSS